MIRDDIKTAYTRTKWALALRGLLGIVLGILIISRPFESVVALALVIAIWALVDGMMNIVRAFSVRDILPHWWVLLLSGLINVGFGIAALYYYPALSLAFAVVWTGLWLLTGGVMGIYISIQERGTSLPWGWTMAFGVFTLIGGILAFMFPQATLASLIALIATVGIVGGVVMLASVVKLQTFERDVTDTMRTVGDRRYGQTS